MGCFVREANASDDQAVKQAATDDASIYAELCFVNKRLQLDTLFFLLITDFCSTLRT